MSSSTTVPDVLNLTAEDAALMLSAGVHLGGKNVNVDMENYVYKKRSDGELTDGSGGGRRRVGYGTAKTNWTDLAWHSWNKEHSGSSSREGLGQRSILDLEVIAAEIRKLRWEVEKARHPLWVRSPAHQPDRLATLCDRQHSRPHAR